MFTFSKFVINRTLHRRRRSPSCVRYSHVLHASATCILDANTPLHLNTNMSVPHETMPMNVLLFCIIIHFCHAEVLYILSKMRAETIMKVFSSGNIRKKKEYGKTLVAALVHDVCGSKSFNDDNGQATSTGIIYNEAITWDWLVFLRDTTPYQVTLRWKYRTSSTNKCAISIQISEKRYPNV